MDPFLTGNPAAPLAAVDLMRPDVILVSHAAIDHLGDPAQISLRTGAPIVCGTDSAALLRERGVPPDQIRTTVWGIQVEVGGVHIRPVESHHWSQARLADGSVITGTPLGFVVETEPDARIYHFGDSAIFGYMRLIGQLHRPTVALLGCTQPKPLLAQYSPGAGRVLTGEMNPEEAALAADFLGVRYAVATHYIDPDDVDVRRFIDLVSNSEGRPKPIGLALRPGESLVIDGNDYHVRKAAPAPTSIGRTP